jgi:hypothetical protein
MPDQSALWLEFHNELVRCNCCRAHVWADKPLCHFRLDEEEGYRFVWDSSFNGEVIIHIGRQGEKIILRWDYRWFTASNAPRNLELPFGDWRTLQRALDEVDFWSLAPTCSKSGLDGANWLIEGRRDDTYHAISRWSPTGPIHDLGRVFFALAGMPLATVTLY